MPAASPWWGAGIWVGPAEIGEMLCPILGDVAVSWRLETGGQSVKATPDSILLHAAALDDEFDSDNARLEAVVASAAVGETRPARIIWLVWDSWLGRGSKPWVTARSAAAVGLARHWALRLAPTATTVNVIALPSGFPAVVPAPTAPVQVAADVEDLAHVVRFFGHPDNSYIIGQLVSLGGGDFVWSNHSL